MFGVGIDNRAVIVNFAASCAEKAATSPSDDEIVDMALGLENALTLQMMLSLRAIRGDTRAQAVKEAIDSEGQSGHVGLVDLGFRYLRDEGLSAAELHKVGEILSEVLAELEARTIRLFNGELE